MSRTVQEKQLPAHHALSVSGVVSLTEIGSFIGRSIDRLMSFARQQEGAIVGAPRTIYHEKADGRKRVLVEVRLPVVSSLTPPTGTELKALPAIEVASTVVTLAESEQMVKILDVVHEWIEAHGYRESGPVQEIYLSPRGETGPDDPYIEIAWPLG